MSFIRTKKIHGREYRYEVEGYRENGKVKQRVLQYLGPVIPVKSNTPNIILKETTAKVSSSGIVSVSIARSLEGQRVFVKSYYKVLPAGLVIKKSK